MLKNGHFYDLSYCCSINFSHIGYWPDCQPPTTCHSKGLIGVYPNCTGRVIEHACSAHQTGRYPDCHWLPCPDAYLSKTGNFAFLFIFLTAIELKLTVIKTTQK